MVAIDRFILLVRALRHDQRGITVPTALMALIASFGLASVAVISTVNVQQGTKRDHDSKEAIAAADAGANIALLRLNRFLPSVNVSHPCVGPNGEYQAPNAGWCPSTAVEKVGDASYSYMVSAFTTGGLIDVVSVGTSGTVSRRVNVALKTLSGKKVFADEKLIGEDEITLEGGPTIETDIGTNGSIVGSGSPTICGNDRHGIGEEAPTPNGPPTCSVQGEETEGNKNLPEIVPPENIASENDNCRLARNCPTEPTIRVDTYSKKVSKTDPWDAGHRAINIGSSQTLTMSGSIYFVCELNVQGKLYMPAGAHVEIYVDTPEHCGLKSGALQVNVGAGAVIESSACNSSQGVCDVPHIYVLGNGSVKLVGTPGTTNEVVIYAPNSEIDLGGNATWNGMLAGKLLKVHGNAKVKSDPNIKEPEITFAGTFQRTRYVECVGATASPPDASC
jgi:hypothetical protein